MRLIVTLLAVVFSMFSAYSQAIATSKEKKSTLSKYSIEYDAGTKKRRTTNRELDKKSSQSSFDFHYSTYLKSDAANKNYSSLLLAYKLDSTNTELFYELAKYYEVSHNTIEKEKFCQKLKSTSLTSALREYAYNTLVSVEPNGILITYGEIDTYPIWILQTLENFRRDVQVLNYDLLQNESYRTRKSKELGIRFSSKYSRPIEVIKKLAPSNENKSIYYSLTVSHLVIKEHQSKLYPTGLALKFSNKNFDNLAVLRTNWEKKFLKQELQKPKVVETDNLLHLNYILPLIQLLSVYEKESNTQQEVQTKQVIRQLAVLAGKEKEVEQILTK
jgi:hypothetical protein